MQRHRLPKLIVQVGRSGWRQATGACADEAGQVQQPSTATAPDSRYLYKPYKAGAFRKGAEGRTKAIIKAGLATAVILKLLSNAKKNAEADPTLCKFVPNIDTIKASLSNLVAKVKGGSATSGDADSTNSLFEQLKSGTGFTPPSNSSLPGLG